MDVVFARLSIFAVDHAHARRLSVFLAEPEGNVALAGACMHFGAVSIRAPGSHALSTVCTVIDD